MPNPVFISIAALVLSLGGFLFSLFQYRSHQRVKKLEKMNEVMQKGFNLRMASQDLRDLIGRSDDVDSQDELLDAIDGIFESAFAESMARPDTTLAQVYELERRIMAQSLELNLISKLVREQVRSNDESA